MLLKRGPHKNLAIWQRITLMLLCLTSGIATAQDTNTDRLKELEAILTAKKQEKAALEKASEQATTEAERHARNLVVVGHDIQQTEGNISRLEVRIESLEAEVTKKNNALHTRREELLQLMASLERLSKRPAALALLQPSAALDTARSASLMGTLVPQLHEMANHLRSELESLATIQNTLSLERFTLKETIERLTDNQQKLKTLLQKRQSDAAQAAGAAQRASTEIDLITREAKTLRELVNKLAARAAKARPVAPARPVFKPDSRSFGDMKGLLSLPVIGSVVEKFGQKVAIGTTKGIRIRTRNGAQVVSPYDGKVVFAGPFRHYGNLLILEHNGNYHSLLSGMSELYNAVGQWVLSGEPVGVMGQEKAENLYLEIRRKGTPINPEPWLQKHYASRKTTN